MKKTDFHTINYKTNIIFNIIIGLLAFSCLMPYLLSISISFTSQDALNIGFSFIPKEFSLAAYESLKLFAGQLFSAYGTTIMVTVIGTICTLFITLTLGYVISRKDFAYRRQLTFIIFFTMLFNPGLVPNYMVITQLLGLKDSIFALIIPLIINPFWILMAKAFFTMSIPDEIIESAKIDGASEVRLFSQIILPISLPLIATIGLFSTLGYWNDWFSAMLYIDDPSINTLQYMLVRIQNNITFLTQNSASLGAAAADVVRGIPEDSFMMAIMIISTLPIACTYPFFQKYFVSGLTIGAVKG